MFQSPPLRHLLVAIQFMTRLPTPAIASAREDDLVRAANWVPAAGLVVGCVLATVYWLAHFGGPVVAALLTLVVWVWLTGALHLDGLADSADGLAAAHRGPDRFLAAARDPYVGAFGVVAIALVLIAKVMVLSATAVPTVIMGASLIVIPALARLAGAVAAHVLPPLGEGRGAGFKAGLSTAALVGWAVCLGGAGLLVAPAAALAGGAIAWLAIWYWRRALGGMSGDTIGATIEAAECAMLVGVLALPISPALVWWLAA